MIELSKVERNHYLKLIYGFVKTVKQFITMFIALGILAVNMLGMKKLIIITAGISLFIFFTQFLEWRKDFFILKDNSIYHESGIFSVKKVEINFSRIHTIDISQNLLERIFKAATIKIDTGESKHKGSELKFILDRKKADKLKNIILKGNISEELKDQDKKYYKISNKQLILYSMISNSIFQGIGILFAIQQFFQQYVEDIININTSLYINEVRKMAIYVIVLLILLLIFIGIIISVIITFLKYYNFRMWTDNKKICVSYGILNKKNYSFDRRKINGIHIRQTIFMQIFGFYTIEIESIGYGDEKGEKAILYPMCNELSKNKIIKKLLSEFEYNDKINKIGKRGHARFFYKKFIFCGIVAFICFFVKRQYTVLTLPLLLILALLGYLQIKNMAFGINKSLVYMGYGGFNKSISIVKMSAVQSMTTSYNYFQNRVGLCDYSVGVYSSNLGKILKAKSMKNDIVGDLFN